MTIIHIIIVLIIGLVGFWVMGAIILLLPDRFDPYLKNIAFVCLIVSILYIVIGYIRGGQSVVIIKNIPDISLFLLEEDSEEYLKASENFISQESFKNYLSNLKNIDYTLSIRNKFSSNTIRDIKLLGEFQITDLENEKVAVFPIRNHSGKVINSFDFNMFYNKTNIFFISKIYSTLVTRNRYDYVYTGGKSLKDLNIDYVGERQSNNEIFSRDFYHENVKKEYFKRFNKNIPRLKVKSKNMIRIYKTRALVLDFNDFMEVPLLD